MNDGKPPDAPRPQPQEVIRWTLAAALLPGAGHLLRGERRTGGLMAAATLALIALAAIQLTVGLSIFESSLGAFVFRALLRGVALIYGFAALDIYLRATRPQDQGAALKRLAILLNLLVPGAGYLVVKAWIRTATGLALLTLILVFAHAGTHRYLDIIYIVMQAVMGGAVYHHIYLQRKGDQGDAAQEAMAPVSTPVPGAQVIVLVVMTLAAIGFSYVALRSVPGGELAPLNQSKDIKAQGTTRGLKISVERLGLTLTAVGDSWQPRGRQDVDFEALIQGQALVSVKRRPLPPFIHPPGQLTLIASVLRRKFEGQGLIHQKTIKLQLNGAPAVQLRFSGDKTQEFKGDFWAVAIPRNTFTYVMMLFCRRGFCKELAPLLEQTRDSFKVVK